MGLNSLMKTWKTPFCSVTFLMRGAVFRPRRLSGKQTRFSLDICSLSELIDQYRNHETTIPHDKVYALLGMSSDDTSMAGLEPNYKLAWAELSQRLVRFLLGNKVAIETAENTGVATIKGKGIVLGTVSSINTTQGWETEVTIGIAGSRTILRNSYYESISCSLPSLPKPIKRGDLVCLLEGAQKPIIVRFDKGRLVIVMIGAVIRRQSREDLLDPVKSIEYYNRDVLLTWDWGNRLVKSQDAPAYDLTQSSDQSDLTSQLNDFTCFWTVALILNDAEMGEEGEEMLGEAKKRHKAILEMMNLHISPEELNLLTPLAFAAKNGYAELASMLLAEGGSSLNLVDRYSRTPLAHAAEQGHLALVKLLLESGRPEIIAAGFDGQTPLSWAAASGQEEVVKLPLKTDQINVNAKDISGATPLSRAAGRGHEGIVKLLLEVDKIEINAKDYLGETPLFKAARIGHEAIVKVLLNNKADVDWRNSDNRTALSCAAENGHEAVARILLDNKADVDSRDYSYRTPLWFAARKGRESMVKILLDQKANVGAEDRDGRTPLSIAEDKGHEAIIKLLRGEDAGGSSSESQGSA